MRAWVLGTVIALIALGVGSVFGDRGILNMLAEREKVEALQTQRLAREELGLARPDETVFLIRDGADGDAP